MPEIKRVELERENDEGVHEVSKGERLEPVEPAPPDHLPAEQSKGRREKDRGAQHDGDEFERATTPFPGG
jgi:hypothetical protein